MDILPYICTVIIKKKKKMNNVKLISLSATNYGTLKAVELDFAKFANSGIIALKGASGEGKSTLQNAIRTSCLGRKAIADTEQYGEEWSTSLQLADGERKIFIEAIKKNDAAGIEYKLYELDDNGKKVNNPIIDGVKATPAAYMQTIANELTFGIKDFLSDNHTTHNKLMFSLFKRELEGIGVIFDKKHPDYNNSLLGLLDSLTEERDMLRAQCRNRGAFMTDFENRGYKKNDLDSLTLMDTASLNKERENLTLRKGALQGQAEQAYNLQLAQYNSAVATIQSDVATYTAELQRVAQQQQEQHREEERVFNEYIALKVRGEDAADKIEVILMSETSIDPEDIREVIDKIRSYEEQSLPTAPQQPMPLFTFVVPNSKDIPQNYKEVYPEVYHGGLTSLLDARARYLALTPPSAEVANTDIDTRLIDEQIANIESKIKMAQTNNELYNDYQLNRKWLEVCAAVQIKREELARLYAKINTGVEGLKMKPFFEDDGTKFELKTVYTGNFAPDYFKNNGDDERLLVSYSSTQRPIIGLLLQVARLKRKAKALPYLFLDDVPMDNTSRKLIERIAVENNLTVITSITGDFVKEKLTNDEILIEGGELFFNVDNDNA